MGQVVIVEGLIGAGKSTFSQELGAALGPTTITLMEPDERNNANPYLADFYGDKTRWSFTMQTHLLAMRYRMQLSAQWHAMSGQGDAVCDRSFYGDTCFARMMHRTGEISDREFETYRVLYQSMSSSVLLPSVIVRLHVDVRTAAERIQRRAAERDGRKSELTIDLDYLNRLNEEIDTTQRILVGQGVRSIDVPWTEDRRDPASRAEVIDHVVNEIKGSQPLDLFLHTHRRVL